MSALRKYYPKVIAMPSESATSFVYVNDAIAAAYSPSIQSDWVKCRFCNRRNRISESDGSCKFCLGDLEID